MIVFDDAAHQWANMAVGLSAVGLVMYASLWRYMR